TIAYYFISENVIRSLFKLRKIKEIEISREQIPQFNSFPRILFSIVSITIMPIIILGYMLFGFRTGLVLLENPGLHLLIMSILFPVPIIIVGYVVARTFSNGIHETNEHLSELGKGKFSIVSMPTSSDDFGLQAYNMNQIIKRLNSMYSEIKDLNSNLEEKVSERTAQVNEMLGRLGEMYADSENKRKEIEALAESRKKLAFVGQLAAGIVHDIKNPMATIKYLAQKANAESISKEKREKNLNLIVREMDRLNDLAYEILDYSKGNLNLELEEINAKDFLLEIEQFLKIDFEYHGINYSLELEYNGKIRIDKDRMRRVIINLAKNAIEAMQDGMREYNFKIRVEKISLESNQEVSWNSTLGRDKNGFILISLIDNGSGIPESIKSRIFEAFATEGKVKGTGLGLFMCKMIVDAHNGSLTYKSEKDKGTIFIIQLPI
ncbi:ATP-binding protein, partial [Dolichospermum sp. ST_sed3]|nr:ATP-binding protein [Dolichospermum sp. ST_sed3]